jgi:hypothetical protein
MPIFVYDVGASRFDPADLVSWFAKLSVSNTLLGVTCLPPNRNLYIEGAVKRLLFIALTGTSMFTSKYGIAFEISIAGMAFKNKLHAFVNLFAKDI